jgi:hypothetical protein
MTLEIVRSSKFQDALREMSHALKETTEKIKKREVRTLMNEYKDKKDKECQRIIADEK